MYEPNTNYPNVCNIIIVYAIIVYVCNNCVCNNCVCIIQGGIDNPEVRICLNHDIRLIRDILLEYIELKVRITHIKY